MAKVLKREKARSLGAVEAKEEKITEEIVSTPIATEIFQTLLPETKQRKLGISKGVTINMGNYESFKISIWQERYCEDAQEVSNKVLAEMSTEISELLEAEVNEVKGA